MEALTDREERVVQAVLADEFLAAAHDLAAEYVKNSINLNAVVRKRERFINLHLMIVTP